MDKQRLLVTGKRFVKALLSGFISGMVVTLPLAHLPQALSWTELLNLLPPLLFGALIGGLNGLLMAGEKFLRWENIPSEQAKPQ